MPRLCVVRRVSLLVLPIGMCLALAWACGSDDGGSLLGGGGGSSGGSSGSSGGDGATTIPLAQQAEDLFRQLEPDLTKACGGPCHTDGTTGSAPRWLAPPDAYVSIKAYPGIVVPDPDSSKLLTKGPHAGPALTGDLATRTRAWLSLEATLLKNAVLPTTDPFAIVSGANTVDISKAGTGVDGTKMTFTATITGSVLTLGELHIVAPPTTAVHVAHPIFVVIPETGPEKPDPVDSFSNTDQTINPSASDPLGPGELILIGWGNSKMRVEFTKLEPGKVVDAGGDGGGGCKSVTTYVSSAVPAIQNNTCLTCHQGQNGGATAALDMTDVGQDNARACAQALTKVNLTDKPNSTIIAAPTGKVQHPYQVADPQGWTNAILGWIQNE